MATKIGICTGAKREIRGVTAYFLDSTAAKRLYSLFALRIGSAQLGHNSETEC
jgi:hypothetical protein